MLIIRTLISCCLAAWIFPNMLSAQGMNHLWQELEEKYLQADLQIEVLAQHEEAGILFQRLYFFSHEISGEPLHVYAIYAQPLHPKEKLPAVVSVHGGGGTADSATAMFLASRGYAAISYDWTGYRRPTGKLSGRPVHKTTHWPPSVYGAPYIKQDITLNLFFNSLFIARRAITFLANQREVDAERIGLTGYSWGGSHTFRLNAMDDRLKVVVPTYGVYRFGKTEEMVEKWGEIFGTLEYAETQKAPLLFITPTNDLGDIRNFDNAQQFVKKLSVSHRQVWLANEDHGVTLPAMEAGYRFLDHYLKGAPALAPSPRLSYEAKAEGIQVSIDAKGASSVELFYSFGNGQREAGSFWESVPTQMKRGGNFTTFLPYAGGMEQVQIYAQGFYADAYELSSLRASIEIPENQFAPAKEDILYDPVMGITPWFGGWSLHSMGFVKSSTRVRVRPSVQDARLCFVQERSQGGYQPKDLKIPSLFNANLRSLSDPKRIPSPTAKLVIEFYCQSAVEVDIRIEQGEAGNITTNLRQLPEFTWTQDLSGNHEWRSLSLEAKDFTRIVGESSEALPDFSEARALQINISPTGEEHPEIGRVYWSY